MNDRREAKRSMKPRLGVFKMASCDGCQLTLLDCEDELLGLAAQVDIVHFPEASSHLRPAGPFDLTLVEGSVSTPEQLEEIRDIRAHSTFLVAIGACATSGGIQALRNFVGHADVARAVYAQPAYVASLATSTPISDHVKVDFELRGCPISKHQLLEVLGAFLVGRRPAIQNEAVCLGCKRAGHVCVTVAQGIPCLGPVTHSGCGAICPGVGRGCYGCFGPRENAETASLATQMRAQGIDDPGLVRAFRSFTGNAPAFRKESERHEH